MSETQDQNTGTEKSEHPMPKSSAAESYETSYKKNGFRFCFKNISVGLVFAYVCYNFFYAIKNFREDAAAAGIEVRPATDVFWMIFSAFCHLVSIQTTKDSSDRASGSCSKKRVLRS